jgi:ribosomal protein S18 acetylase RimI-like enzyme
MMQIRAIHPAEVEAFANTSTRPEDAEAVRNYLDRLLAGGFTRLDWCFVAADAGQFLGRVAYWTLPRVGKPLDVVLLDVPWEHEYQATGTRLLEETAAIMRRRGATDLGHILDWPAQPPQWQRFPERRHELLTQVGFTPIRETLRFKLNAEDEVRRDEGRLAFRSLTEVGEAAFLEAIQRVSTGSLDQRDRDDRAEYGPEQTVRNLYAQVQALDYDPAWWQLAYNKDTGELVGLVMPAATMSWGTIGYIGVVPKQRGHGYIDNLLARGTAILTARGGQGIQADTDVANKPMANAFRRAGYTEFAIRREYNWRYHP